MSKLEDLKLRTVASLQRMRDPKYISHRMKSVFAPKPNETQLQIARPRPTHQPISIMKNRKPSYISEDAMSLCEIITADEKAIGSTTLRLRDLSISFAYPTEGRRHNAYDAACKVSGERLLRELGYPPIIFIHKYPELFGQQSSCSLKSLDITAAAIPATLEDEEPWWFEDGKPYDFFAPRPITSPIPRVSDSQRRGVVKPHVDARMKQQAELQPPEYYFPFDFSCFMPCPQIWRSLPLPPSQSTIVPCPSANIHTYINIASGPPKRFVFLYLLWYIRAWITLLIMALALYIASFSFTYRHTSRQLRYYVV
ncbi:hypothetical protein BOTBODRAFT_44755 [Botryobasidium botryosum FD-172 SS1]|uniref:Uncharacterized protein n=1 Tax=Botryobasidium botryosum (strain FD-172 SS1) TaxID=930990 RepID=A0A067MI78_BOTB1|nr:hypothetical protein BOTBODRAFT_44755 [Botryobasidium botryosum FD-172 SS1]